jgi:hypothetical protein
MLVIFLTSSTDALEWYSVGDFFLITFIFSLKRHHFLPYHLDHLFHYHIYPEQAQDQSTTQVNLFLQNHSKKII